MIDIDKIMYLAMKKDASEYSLNCWNKTSNESEKRFNKL